MPKLYLLKKLYDKLLLLNPSIRSFWNSAAGKDNYFKSFVEELSKSFNGLEEFSRAMSQKMKLKAY